MQQLLSKAQQLRNSNTHYTHYYTQHIVYNSTLTTQHFYNLQALIQNKVMLYYKHTAFTAYTCNISVFNILLHKLTKHMQLQSLKHCITHTITATNNCAHNTYFILNSNIAKKQLTKQQYNYLKRLCLKYCCIV